MDMGMSTEKQVRYHRQKQAEGLTVNLTPDHEPSLVKEVHELRHMLEDMPLQLYAQCVTLTHVARIAWEHGMLYFSQRMPGELARFSWIIDAKGESVTPQENLWRQGDYSAYRRSFPKMPLPDYLSELVPPTTRRRFAGDLGAVFGRDMKFANSREHVGLQIADILTNCVRRALIGNLEREGWMHIRNLMIRRRDGSLNFITLGEEEDSVSNKPYGSVGLELADGRRSLLIARRRSQAARRASRSRRS